MDIKKTLRYNWEFGRETVAIRVSSYRNNGNLYVGLCHKEGREWEDFGDVTINLCNQQASVLDVLMQTVDKT